jgi:hypothetical protein
MTEQQYYDLGFEIVAGMHAQIRDGDMEYGRAETLADTLPPTDEELAQSGLTEIPEYAIRGAKRNKERLDKQIDWIAGVAMNKIEEMGLQLAPNWVSTADRLPEKTGKSVYEHIYCLVVKRGTLYIEILAWNCEEKCWDDDAADEYECDATDVSFWMPFPDPPKLDLNGK